MKRTFLSLTLIGLAVAATAFGHAAAQAPEEDRSFGPPQSVGRPMQNAIRPSGPLASGPLVRGPIKDVTYQVIWLIESDDVNRVAYEGPAVGGLQAAGYGRLVTAGIASAGVTIGMPSTVSGTSRYGQLSVLSSLLNTTEKDELQIKIKLQTKNQSPLMIDTVMRAPLGRWFLIGSADSRVGLPKHADDGKRGVAIMKITNGVMLLDAPE